ncbi:RHS Repeat protein [Phycisphaerae bacterium RAS1]|nr:RHS Repeat protein [Phycisphaerae bacterium RAS1]
MCAAYFYDGAGRLERIENSNGTKTYFYEYDAAHRLLKLRHESAAAQVLSRIEYTWNLDNTVATRTEYDATVSPATTDVTTFTYDQRHRLISENRVRNGSTAVYAIEYDYDALGNRKEKRLTLSDGLHVTDYTYDVDSDDPENELTYPTRNNRLLSYREYGPDEELQRTVYYTYYDRGACSNITIKDESSPSVRKDLGLFYNGNGTLWIALWSQWQVNEQGVPQSFEMTAAKEFRFDRPRQRYLMRDLDPNNGWAIVGSGVWTDYIGDAPHLDYTVSSGAAVTHSTAYLTGAGTAVARESFTSAVQHDPASVEFLHGDLVGSTILRTDSSGSVAQPPSAVSYTAFGEPVAGGSVGGALPSGFSRYGYAGYYGYESDSIVMQGVDTTLPALTLAHLGARWYQAGIGRFVQRDPVGLADGLNAYAYVANDPSYSVDFDGLKRYRVLTKVEHTEVRIPLYSEGQYIGTLVLSQTKKYYDIFDTHSELRFAGFVVSLIGFTGAFLSPLAGPAAPLALGLSRCISVVGIIMGGTGLAAPDVKVGTEVEVTYNTPRIE